MNNFILNGNYSYMWGNKLECMFAMKIFEPKVENINRHIKMASLQKFKDQVRWADSIYFFGGDTPTLIQALYQAENWQSELKDKTIVAVSAGISALMEYSFNIDYKIILRGLGILPFKSIVHYRNDMSWMINRLDEVAPDLPTLVIPDYSLTILRR